MNIENLASYLNSQEPFTEKVQSEIMQLLEKYPYFQIAHMLLLKSMQQIQPENYNKQLKISGSFISNKRKLFQFINSDIALITAKETEKGKEIDKKEVKPVEKRIIKEEQTIVKEEKSISETTPIVKTVEKKVETKREIESEVKKVETKKTITEAKEIKKEPIKKGIVRTKVDLPENEIEKISNENSKQKHHDIIKDFFHSSEKKKLDKKIIEPSKEVSEASITEVKKEIPEEKRIIREIKKEIQVEKEIPSKRIIKEVKISEKETAKTTEPIKETKIEEVINKVEKKTEPEVFEKSKELITAKRKKTGNEADAMNNIFSKIRQIKKEMNINSESTPKTIDIETDKEKSQTKNTEIRKSSSGRVIKESFIGFDENSTTEKQEQLNEEKEERKEVIFREEESNQIKQSELTAKDLFKKHKLKKEKSTFLESEQSVKKEETIKSGTSPISKLVEVVNEKTIKTTEPIKEEQSKEAEKEPTIIEEKSVIQKEEPVKKEETISTSGTESVADAMLRRIAEKKQRMQQEKLEEERKKEEERRKELEAVDELIKSSTKKEVEIETPDLTKDEKKEDSELQKEETIDEKTEVPAKKSNKLIDSFIEKVDSLDRIGTKETKLSGDISIESTVESEEIMTETYADLLIEQKNYIKAIDVYNKLILKFPEKKTYFAIQIKKVESLIK